MKRKSALIICGAVLLAGAVGYGSYRLGVNQAASGQSSRVVQPRHTDQSGRRVLYWHDPMVPGLKFDKPGKSPFMDMDLVPVYADEQAAAGAVNVGAGVQQNLGVRLAEVRKGSLDTGLRAVGSIVFNEREVVLVQARSNGYVERLLVRAPLDPVRKGQAMLQMYVPDWVAAQEDYLAIKRMPAGAASDGLLGAALQRMRLAGMTEDQIRQVAERGNANARVTVTAPAGGVVTDLAAREGMTVSAGAPLFRINGLDTVWVNAEIPESASGQVLPGTPVEAAVPAFPGTTFRGKVATLLPQVSTATRTLTARIELANPGGKLVPGMFATVRILPASRREVLLVPSEAVIQTGTRTVVIAALDGGKFAPVDIVAGTEADGMTEVREGLSAGQKVVASGQFLIDSESSLRGALRRMGDQAPAQPGKAPPAAAPTHHATGKVERIGPDGVTISHGPVPSLKWGPMTMGFAPPAGGLPQDIAAGDSVSFDFQASESGAFRIVSIAKTSPGKQGAGK